MCAQPYQIPWDPHGLYHARFLLSMWFPSLEYWSGLPYPPPGDLPAQASMPRSPTLAAFLSSTLVFYHWATRKIFIQITNTLYPTWNSSLILTLLFLVMFPTPNSLNKVINDLLKVKTMNFHYTNIKSKLLPIQKALNDLTHSEMATHYNILAWKNPRTEESGRLKSMGLHDWACVHEGGGRWVGSNKLVELKK